MMPIRCGGLAPCGRLRRPKRCSRFVEPSGGSHPALAKKKPRPMDEAYSGRVGGMMPIRCGGLAPCGRLRRPKRYSSFVEPGGGSHPALAIKKAPSYGRGLFR